MLNACREPKPEGFGETLLGIACDIGMEMMICGAEIGRVEDAAARICMAYGAADVHVFSITYSILVTLQLPGEPMFTQSRRVDRFAYDLHRLNRLNALSRRLCAQTPPLGTAREALEAIRASGGPGPGRILAAYAMISAAFAIFFGGSPLDAAAAGLIGLALFGIEKTFAGIAISPFFRPCVGAFCAGVLAGLAAKGLPVCQMDKISIGNIMVLIPGLMITNSFREMFSNNLLSGSVRFLESVLIALAIAVGMALAWALVF